ncbi:MAG TPA: Rrf2 family transcriptional regulator [Sphingomonas sp.]|nr:Rrf2 family transcriptional regulator [Sphingomonas sp.]
MLSQKTRYALRALIHLAREGEGRAVPAAEIAQLQQVPRKYCELILLDLKRGGLIASRRGPGGGYALARPPEQIDFAEVIRLTDGPIAMVPCASLNFYERCDDCHDEATCAIRKVMAKVRAQAAQTLSGTTLADAARAEASEAA